MRRLRLAMRRQPLVHDASGQRALYPGGRRAAFVVSADLELGWGWRYARAADPVALAARKARQGRRNVAELLELCDQYDVPITWATVGHLFLEGCERSGGPAHPGLPRVPYFSNEWWSYEHGDWFDADPRCQDRSGVGWPEMYAPDVIEAILARRVPHEIGCHTFSHIPLSDSHCPPNVAAAELRCCQASAEPFGIQLRSLVFPGNAPGNYCCLRDAGFIAYRAPSSYRLDAPERDALGLWRIPPGVCLEQPPPPWTTGEHIDYVRAYIDATIESGRVGGFWFHPEMPENNLDKVFPAAFAQLAARRDDLWMTTLGGLAEWLETHTPQVTSAATARTVCATRSISGGVRS